MNNTENFAQFVCVFFSDMGVFEPIAETVITAESGRAAVIAFPQIESEPPPSVIWQDENGALRYDQKYAVTKKHELVILCTSHEDEKAYRLKSTLFSQ